MNKQDIFDRVATHLLEQGEASIDENLNCVYLNEDGLRCAIGCLIPDNHNALKEECDVAGILRHYPDLSELWEIEGDKDLKFLDLLQIVHDDGNPDSWESQLHSIAIEEGLETTVLPNFK